MWRSICDVPFQGVLFLTFDVKMQVDHTPKRISDYEKHLISNKSFIQQW